MRRITAWKLEPPKPTSAANFRWHEQADSNMHDRTGVEGADQTGTSLDQQISQFRRGRLIVNADDWGRNYEATVRTEECFLGGAISSVSAMVFMEDSERAADIARERGIDTGLHLNFTTSFSGPGSRPQLVLHQERVARYLRGNRLAQALFHPGLVRSFQYIVTAQWDEFSRLYGAQPGRLDGHHHMHLCANVLLQSLLPAGIIVRRNFSFQLGEKGFLNRSYRMVIDSWLARSHPMTDYFFSLPPLESPRVERIAALAREAVVEVETHPINPDEYRFLLSGELLRCAGEGVSIAPEYVARRSGPLPRPLPQ